jgi:hypothetical protein
MRKCNGFRGKIMRKLVIIGKGLGTIQFMVDWRKVLDLKNYQSSTRIQMEGS